MTAEEQELYLSVVAFTARENMSRAAEIQVLKEVIAKLIARTDGLEEVEVLKELQKKMTERKEQFLMKAEDMNPGIAALLDKDRPPPPAP